MAAAGTPELTDAHADAANPRAPQCEAELQAVTVGRAISCIVLVVEEDPRNRKIERVARPGRDAQPPVRCVRVKRPGNVRRDVAARLALAIDDEATRRIVGGNRDGNAISEDDADAMAPDLTRELREYLVAVVELDPKVTAFRDQDDLAVEMNQLFLAHVTSLGPLVSTKWARRKSAPGVMDRLG